MKEGRFGKELGMVDPKEDPNYEGEEESFDKARERFDEAQERLDKAEERLEKNRSDEGEESADPAKGR